MSKATAAELIRGVRRRTGWTQTRLARECGVPQSVLSAYERGRREPGVEALSRILGVAGFRLALVPRVDVSRAGALLPDLLGLSDALPRRRRGPLVYPRLP